MPRKGRAGNGVQASQPVATRPLAIQINGTWYTYGWDLTKNICELYGTNGYIVTTYTYSPFGQVTASGNVTQPIQWSSEVWDGEMGLVYYNWRYYGAMVGRWITYDPMNNQDLYFYFNPSYHWDMLGLKPNINYLPKTPRKNALSEYECAEKYISDPSYFVIVAHGGPRFITGPDNNLMDASELATKMVDSGYKFNKIVKLISCNTGSLKDGFAQELANHLYAIWKKSYQYIKNPHIIIAAPDTLTEIEYINNDGIFSYKVYPAGEFGGLSTNPATGEITYISPPEITYKTFIPCK